MSITELKSAFVETTAASIQLSQMFNVTAAANDPTYLVLTTLDRNEYTAGATGATGRLTGAGASQGFANIGGDARGTGIVFTYQPASGEYYNSTYGDFDQLAYISSGSLGDVTDLSVFGTSSSSLANADAANAYTMAQADPSGYLGTATVVTEPNFDGRVPAQATPGSIAAAADGLVGHAWNEDGCWVLCSTIAASAGAALAMQSTLIGLAGRPSGEWIVAFNGPAGQSGNWQALVKAGEMVVIGTPGGGGHVTTCVAGSGSTATLVDNEVIENGSGQMLNPANDGSGSDITIQAGHLASQEWTGVQAASVVIYELDTPIVTDTVTSDGLAGHASQSLASLFSAADPAGKAITEWQVYNSAAGDALVTGGTGHYGANTCWTALTVASLGSVALLAGGTATTDTLEVRAYNGSFWGDWQSLAVTTTAPAAAPPVRAAQTPKQSWATGKPVSLALPAKTFTDPQGESLVYTATLASGHALPGWLHFNALTETFSGTAPAKAVSMNVKVTATDTSKLAGSESFAVGVVAPVPVSKSGITVTATASQVWTDGQKVEFLVPAKTFSDALGHPMTFAAFQVGGPNVSSWLGFNPTTDEFSGTVPATASGSTELEVFATDALHMTAADLFSVTFASSTEHLAAAVPAGVASMGGRFDPPEPANMLPLHS